MTSAIENVVNRIDINEQTTALRLKRLGEEKDKQAKEMQELRDALDAEKSLGL